ncbi:uncharacterized protein olf186-M isoform X2 [Planococcus citri]|uniref:uncharacterized protein olf186-M isoform X2 n=1 Tax=Planococcus citri TaxID=170843 RepID=UPI0031F983A1
MDESGRERIQNRAQEWVKKLHPDALRNRLRNFRRYVISATIEKRDSSSTPVATDETSASTAALATQSLRNDCHISTNSTRRNENLDVNRFNIESRKSSHSQNGRGRLTLSMGDARIPDVIVQENSVSSQNCAMESDLSGGAKNNLQLAINVDATPRNKSPITVQEWIDSLPLTSVESSREESEVSDKSAVPLGDCENDNLTLGAEAGYLVDVVDKKRTPTIPPPPVNVTITGPGGQEPSEVESHCSSVDSLLEARKPDPEEVLLSLGFGGTASSSYLETGRIPKRFLQQSQLKGVDIEDFIRQQQDLIYTFESGYYGYRGLAGPSHSNPSVIVAKILEKLREHERETTSMTSYQLDFRKPCSLEKNPDNGAATNKFSKVARNVLTKIRCTPSSVLSPDNRRWLDSQGSKSPEIARRLIIGQKSFTFGRDGDLIEASNLDNIDRIDSKCDTNEPDSQTQTNTTTQQANQCAHVADLAADIVDRVLNSCGNLGRRFTDSSTDMSVESIIMKNGDDKTFSNSFDGRSVREETNENALKTCILRRLNHVDVDESVSLDSCDDEAQDSRSEAYSRLRVAVACQPSSSSECTRRIGDNDYAALCDTTQCSGASSSAEMSLQEELQHSGVALTDPATNRGSFKKLRNVLTRCSSFEESYKETSDDETVDTVASRSAQHDQSVEKVDHYADSATESEFASYTHRSLADKTIHRQYEELILLESVLHNLGRPIKIITKEQFSAISSEQRCAVQIQIIREALKAYLNQMTEDEIHSELKNCLSAEVQKVADLLDNSSDASKLAVIVKQMTLLLQHQSQLSAQIKELSVVDKKPTSCHELCDHILKRVHELELLVQQNAQELAQMKYQLLKKDHY